MGNACKTVTRDVDNFIDSVCNTAEDEIEKVDKIAETAAEAIEGKCKPVKLSPWNESVLVRKSYDEIKNTCKVGDCIFLYGKNLVSQGPEMFQNCNVAHVVQVFKIEEDTEGERKVHFLESTIDKDGFGVQTHDDLRECLNEHQIAWLVSLDEKHQKILEEREEELLGWEELQIGKSYSILQAVSSVFADKKQWPVLHNLFFEMNKMIGPSDKSYFCSGLVCAAFVHIGVIVTEKKFQWNLCTPKEFLKLNIWKNEIVQFKGYKDKKKEEEVIVPPIEEKDFRSMTPEEWNEYASEE